MKQLEKPFSDYWYGKDLVKTPGSSTESNVNESEDAQYRALKRAIQQEALRKWGRA